MVSKSLNKVTEIGVRLNPDFSGKASKFGVDEDISMISYKIIHAKI